jgi:hypothetical protein
MRQHAAHARLVGRGKARREEAGERALQPTDERVALSKVEPGRYVCVEAEHARDLNRNAQLVGGALDGEVEGSPPLPDPLLRRRRGRQARAHRRERAVEQKDQLQ